MNGNIPDNLITTPPTNSTATKSYALSTDSTVNRTLFESEMHTFSDDSSSDLEQQQDEQQQNLKKQHDLQTEQVKQPPPPLGQVTCNLDHGSSSTSSTTFDDDLSDIAPLSLSFSDRLSMARSKHTQAKKKLDPLSTVAQKKRSRDSDNDSILKNRDGMNQNGADKANSDLVTQRKQKRRKNSISKDPLLDV